MTCIAGLVDGGRVYIGGDSAGTSGWDLTIRADEKVFANGEFLFGFTTSFRMGQLLRYAFIPPIPKEGQDTAQFMVTDFVNAARDCLKAGGFARKHDEQESGGTFLVGFRARLFEIDTDYQVGQPADGYTAIGCGDKQAVGSLFSTRGASPEDRIRTALSAAERHSAAVRGPFVILSQ
jgi:ATP-dependent protease HslVU (ClpYQ) peptidase subunit